MKRIIIGVLAVLVSFMVVACGEQQDRLTVSWMGDGEYAMVSVVNGNQVKNTYKLRCKENNVTTPFEYVWEYDCDLNTHFNGYSQDWDNPEDERFEDRRFAGSEYEGEDEGIDIGDVALGAVAGHLLTKKGKKVDPKKQAVTSTPPPVPQKNVTTTSKSSQSKPNQTLVTGRPKQDKKSLPKSRPKTSSTKKRK